MLIRSPFPPLPQLPATNTHNILFRTPERLGFGDYVMYIDAVTGQQWTRYDLVKRIYDAMTALRKDTSQGGLGLTSSNVEYCTLVHALLRLTVPSALFSSYATVRELTHYFERAKPTHIFVHVALFGRLQSVAQEHGFPDSRIFIIDGYIYSVSNHRTLGSMVGNVHCQNLVQEPVREAGKNALAYSVFSSGTFGLPKAVMVSHGNINFALQAGASVFMEAAQRKPSPPKFHPINACATFNYYLLPRWNLDLAITAIERHRITTVTAIPSVIYALQSSPKFKTIDSSSIVSISSGGAYLPPILANKMPSLVKTADISGGYKVSGLQVSPTEVEDIILEDPSDIVSDAAVAGIHLPTAQTADDRVPRAWVVLTPQGKKLSEKEAEAHIISWGQKNLSKYKWLRGGIEFVSEITKNPTGKVLRQLLTERYEAKNVTTKL
ncbi:hypothetical protein M422DRAFT_782659 [Sphaerobolus stellatus SS14]|uniref:Acetyl-CoA synthetase-like protein n=1 Tax=Sphaerobolus stellatus (strain SS14) TaxID=990650 RepID=A0A0C9VBR8_SPHS4|nr:hypothetical protein M422DRAFT_782659 [Sphaerobolus stellatus SS14]